MSTVPCQPSTAVTGGATRPVDAWGARPDCCRLLAASCVVRLIRRFMSTPPTSPFRSLHTSCLAWPTCDFRYLNRRADAGGHSTPHCLTVRAVETHRTWQKHRPAGLGICVSGRACACTLLSGRQQKKLHVFVTITKGHWSQAMGHTCSRRRILGFMWRIYAYHALHLRYSIMRLRMKCANLPGEPSLSDIYRHFRVSVYKCLTLNPKPYGVWCNPAMGSPVQGCPGRQAARPVADALLTALSAAQEAPQFPRIPHALAARQRLI